MLHVVLWKWRSDAYRSTYEARHVNRVAHQVRAALGDVPHRVVCVTDDPKGVECETHPLWSDLGDIPSLHALRLPSCYRRLKLFDPETQTAMGVAPGDRILSLDLDVAVVGDLRPLVDRDEDVVAWLQPGATAPGGRQVNGSVLMLRAGARPDVWREFDPRTSPQTARAAGWTGSDQSWLSHRLVGRCGVWTEEDGVRSWSRVLRRHGRELLPGTRVAVFHGKNKPWDVRTQAESPWVTRYWPDKRGAEVLRGGFVRRPEPAPPPAPRKTTDAQIVVVLWLWRQEGFRIHYGASHVNVMARRLREVCARPPRVMCITDDPSGITECETQEIWSDLEDMRPPAGSHLPSCYRRLRLFDPDAQRSLGIARGTRIVSLDLDTVVCRDVGPVIRRGERFVGWVVPGTYKARVLNGSVFSFEAGDLSEVWHSFDSSRSPEEARRAGYMGTDQGWMSRVLLDGGYEVGALGWPEVASYAREIRPRRMLPRETCLVFFHGTRKPWNSDVRAESSWVSRYWRDK